jgi:MYXO-CTERM domain-containing protein
MSTRFLKTPEGKKMKRLFTKTLFLALLAATGLAFTPRTASADITGYFISDGNDALDPYTAPYALVLINRTSTTTANILFLSDSANGYWFGDGNSVDVNSNGLTSVSNIASTGCRVPSGCGTVVDAGAGNVSEFGNFNHTFNTVAPPAGANGWQGVANQISFTLTLLAGQTPWANVNQVLVNNTDGSLAAAHIFVGAANASSALVTGFAGNGVTTTQQCFGCSTSVPDGGMTVSMLGMAMAGLGLVARRRWL